MCGRGLGPGLDLCCIVVATLAQVHEADLEKVVAVISALVLPDGSGFDVLAYTQGHRPDLGVILTGAAEADDLALEAAAAGASEFIPCTEPYVRGMRHAVARCIAQQRVRLENQRLQQELSVSVAELALANDQLHQMIVQLEQVVRTDDLTGLANRRWLDLRLRTEWAEASRFGLPLAFLMIDLDGFKQLNDGFGHQQGDDMLRLASRVIKANCREVDVVARYGGDEFCVLMTNTHRDEALTVANRILGECRQARLANARTLSMSIGLAHNLVSRPASADQLLKHADEAMYAAKWAGKNRVIVREASGTVSVAPTDAQVPADPNQPS